MSATARRVVTIDLWNTLLDGEPLAEARHAARVARTHALIADYGYTAGAEEVAAAFAASTAAMMEARGVSPRDPGPRAQVEDMLRRLDPLRAPDAAVVTAVHVGMTAVLYDFQPVPFAGVVEALAVLGRLAPLGLVSNTGWSGGATLRPVLRQQGISPHLAALAFSDEVGWGKPDDRIFCHCLAGLDAAPPHTVLHVGDSLRADIAGAKRLGARACWITPPGEETEAALRALDPLWRPDLVFPSVAAACTTLDLWLRGELFPA